MSMRSRRASKRRQSRPARLAATLALVLYAGCVARAVYPDVGDATVAGTVGLLTVVPFLLALWPCRGVRRTGVQSTPVYARTPEGVQSTPEGAQCTPVDLPRRRSLPDEVRVGHTTIRLLYD